MYPVSQDFHNQMKAQSRRIHAKIQVDYTDPFIDQSIQVSTSENANYSYPEQVADSIQEPYGKIASLDGSWVLDGTYVLAPTPEESEQLQMGWWGSQLSDSSGNYTAPYPTLSVTFAPRPIRSLQVIADNKRKEWPVNFEINLYSNDTLMYTETVTGNTEIFWSTDIERVNEITKMELIITKWSHANRQVKILEFFTSIQETYETDDILLINLLEEREVSQGSLPVGNISSNEIDIRLVNENGRFDAGNRQSPLYQLLKPNRRIKAWLRGEPAQIINPKPIGGHLWHFDRSVVSTDGIQPLSGAVYTLRPNEGKFGGCVAVEEGTTNLVPSSVLKFEGWIAYSGAQVTLAQNVEFPEIGRNDATRIRTTGGTHEAKYYINIERPSIANQSYTGSVCIKNIGSKPVQFTTNLGPIVTVDPGEWARAIISANGNGTSYFQLQFRTLNVDDDLDFIAWGPQAEHKPFATSFVDGTRAAGGRLSYPKSLIAGLNALTVAAWTSGPPYWASGYRYLFAAQTTGTAPHGDVFALRQTGDNNRINLWVRNDANSAVASLTYDNVWDGNWHLIVGVINKFPQPGRQPIELYVDGELVASDSNVNAVPDLSNIDETWGVQVGNWRGSLRWNGLIDELLILPYAATEEEIKAWYNSNAPFYDTEIKEWVPLGTFWSGDWTAPEGEIYVQTTGRDRLEILSQSIFSSSQVYQNKTLYDLAKVVLEDAGIKEEEYWIDTELQEFLIPYAYFEPVSHREALRKITEAGLGQCYCDRNGLIRLEGYSYLQSKTEPDIVITRDDYFKKDNPNNYMQMANYIEVETQPLRPAPTEEVYRSNEPISINAGETISITAYYNAEPCIEPVASIEGVGSIAEVTYYSWGADVKVTSSTAGEFELVINAKPLKIQGAEKIVAKDDDSIRENGRIKYTFPKNPLVQTRQQAQKIADNLLAYFKDPRRDLTVEWRGNPALLLGDRVRIVDEYGGEDFFVTQQNIEYDGGLKVSMEGRKADVERY